MIDKDRWRAEPMTPEESRAFAFAKRRIIGLLKTAAVLPDIPMHNVYASAYLQGVRDATYVIAELERKNG